MKYRIPTLLLAALIAASAASCGSSGSTSDTTAASGDTTAAEAAGYAYPTDYAGQEFRILNINDIFSMHAKITAEENTGESLNDAQFNAVTKFEEMTGTTIVETNIDLQKEFQVQFPQTILAGDDLYDIVYMNQRDYWTYASQNYMLNLLEVEGFHLDADYWNKAYNDEIIVNDKLFAAQGYAHLTLLDAIGALIFNKSMMETYNLEAPYQAVKDGKWTMDLYQTYIKSAANLNGDEAFEWTAEGQCTWGLVLPNNTGNLLVEMGENTVTLQNGKLVLSVGSERFYNVCEKIASLFSLDAGSVVLAHYNGDDLPDSYVGIFENQRAMFGQTEVAKAGRLRDKDFEFGLLPKPKYDEAQERYYSVQSYPASGVSIPVTSTDPVKAAKLSDALNYIFKEDVYPIFREVTLEQKHLRDEESVEMLDILIESAVPNYSTIFSLDTSGFYSNLASQLRSGNSAVASVVASNENALKAAVDKVNNAE